MNNNQTDRLFIDFIETQMKLNEELRAMIGILTDINMEQDKKILRLQELVVGLYQLLKKATV